jgi:hypothetical protein
MGRKTLLGDWHKQLERNYDDEDYDIDDDSDNNLDYGLQGQESYRPGAINVEIANAQRVTIDRPGRNGSAGGNVSFTGPGSITINGATFTVGDGETLSGSIDDLVNGSIQSRGR